MGYERFFLYSLRRGKKIRVLLQLDTMQYVNLTVLAMEKDSFSFLRSGRKTPETLPYTQVLAAAYARGDDGDTLKDEMGRA